MHKHPRRIIVDTVRVIDGVLPDGTQMGKFLIESANMGDIEWMLTPRQAHHLADILAGYASNYLPAWRTARHSRTIKA